MKKAKYLTTGEFAKLCRTTKETLFHYDRTGLLKPRHVSENGYRRYGAEQFFDFDMILTLKDTGSPLKEIQKHMDHADSNELLALLEARLDVVREERARLAERETMLRDVARLAREALDAEYGKVVLEYQQEERLDVLAVEIPADDSLEEDVERYAEYFDFYEKQGKSPRYPFGTLVPLEDVRQGRFAERFFFSRATKSTPASRLHVKRAGRYAVLAHKGDTASHRLAWERLLRHMEHAGLHVSGNAYIYDMVSYIVTGSGKEYAARYCLETSDG